MIKLICGKNSVFDAIKNKIKIEKIYSIKPIEIDENIDIEIVDKNFLDNLTKLNHQGIAAIISGSFTYASLETILKDKPKIILILDHIKDSHNFGAIIRTANAANINHIIIPDKRSVEVNEAVLKVSSGGFVGMKIAKVSSLQATIEKLKKNEYWIYSSALNENAKNYHKVIYNFPLAIIVGNEAKGISKTTEKASDELIYIPMKGSVQSLNVSVATGILLFELTKEDE